MFESEENFLFLDLILSYIYIGEDTYLSSGHLLSLSLLHNKKEGLLV